MPGNFTYFTEDLYYIFLLYKMYFYIMWTWQGYGHQGGHQLSNYGNHGNVGSGYGGQHIGVPYGAGYGPIGGVVGGLY